MLTHISRGSPDYSNNTMKPIRDHASTPLRLANYLRAGPLLLTAHTAYVKVITARGHLHQLTWCNNL
jgi:hypothetical protein